MNSEEFIICAAIHIKDSIVHKEQPDNIKIGFVIAGRRHGDCYRTITDILGTPTNDYLKYLGIESDPSGFITSTNRFVDREEAWKIAKEQGQIIHGLEASDWDDQDDLLKGFTGTERPKSILISENLY